MFLICLFKTLSGIFGNKFCSVQFSRTVVSDSLWSHEPQHATPPCPSPSPGVHPDSRPSSPWCHPAISSSVVPFSSSSSFYNWENRDSAKLSKLLQVSEQVSGGAKISVQVCLVPESLAVFFVCLFVCFFELDETGHKPLHTYFNDALKATGFVAGSLWVGV